MAKLCRQFATFDRAKLDAEKRTVEIAFSSEYAVDRGEYDEILDHAPESCDLARMKDGAPLLLCHDAWDGQKQIGVVDAARIDSDKIGRATVRFGKTDLANQIWQDVQDGIRRHVSVGYARTGIVASEKKNNREIVRYRWMPFELSIVPVPADPTVGVGRGEPIQREFSTPDNPMKRSHVLYDANPAAGGGGVATLDPAKRTELITEGGNAERKRSTAIRKAAEALCDQYKATPEALKKFRELEISALEKGTSSEDFNAELLAALPGVRKFEGNSAVIGMTDKDKKRYSLMRAMQSCLQHRDGKLNDGFELECSQEVTRLSGMRPDGFFVPADIDVDLGLSCNGSSRLRDMGLLRRDLNVTTATQGGNFVQTTLQLPIIELLRNRIVSARLGVQVLSGLQGNIAIPRQTGGATAYSVSEQAAITKSTQAIDQISMTPKRVGAWNNYTKQLLLQSSPDIENFIRDDLMKVVALKHDKLILEGTGAGNEPTGVLHTVGIGSITFGGAAFFGDFVDMETALGAANADVGRMGYVMNATARGKLKQATKVAASTFPNYIWEKGTFGDGTNDGEINGYRAACSNQVSGALAAFGNWEDAVEGMWGGFDVVVDPLSVAEQALVRIIVNTFIDVAIRHAASFCWSTDSAAQ